MPSKAPLQREALSLSFVWLQARHEMEQPSSGTWYELKCKFLQIVLPIMNFRKRNIAAWEFPVGWKHIWFRRSSLLRWIISDCLLQAARHQHLWGSLDGMLSCPSIFLLHLRGMNTFRLQGWRQTELSGTMFDAVALPRGPVLGVTHPQSIQLLKGGRARGGCGFTSSKAVSHQVFLYLYICLFHSLSKHHWSFFLHWPCIFVPGWWWMEWASCLWAAQKWMFHFRLPIVLPHVYIWQWSQRGHKAQGHFSRNVFQQSSEKAKT